MSSAGAHPLLLPLNGIRVPLVWRVGCVIRCQHVGRVPAAGVGWAGVCAAAMGAPPERQNDLGGGGRCQPSSCVHSKLRHPRTARLHTPYQSYCPPKWSEPMLCRRWAQGAGSGGRTSCTTILPCLAVMPPAPCCRALQLSMCAAATCFAWPHHSQPLIAAPIVAGATPSPATSGYGARQCQSRRSSPSRLCGRGAGLRQCQQCMEKL